MDVEALIRSLNRVGKAGSEAGWYDATDTAEKAATAIRTLSARLVAAEQKIAAATEESEDFRAGIAAEMEARVAAEQERDRLAEALRQIATLLDEEIRTRFGTSSHLTEVELAGTSRVYPLLAVPRNMARAALFRAEAPTRSLPDDIRRSIGVLEDTST